MRKKVLLKVSACCLVVIMSFNVLIQGTLATKEKSTIPISHDDTETVSHSKNTPNPETDFDFSSSTGTITKYKGSAGTVIIPDTIGGIPVKVIGDDAFNYARINKKVLSITLPSTLKSIGNSAFYNQDISYIDFPNGLDRIEGQAFLNCTQLKEVILPDSVSTLGESAFKQCESIEKVVLSSNLTEIPNSCFYSWTKQGALNDIIFKEGLEVIGANAFMNQSLKNVQLPNSVRIIDQQVFARQADASNHRDFYIGTGIEEIRSQNGIPNIANAFSGWKGRIIFPLTKDVIDSRGANAILDYPNSSFKVFYANIVDYNTNGGNPASIPSETVLFEDTIKSIPVQPIKDGFSFAGWYSDSALTNLWNFTTSKVTSDITLYAKWVPIEWTITFDTNGGSAIEKQKVNMYDFISEPSTPIKNGYTFAGWYSDSALTNPWNFTTSKVTSDITLYAKWVPIEWTITFDTNGGSAIEKQKVNMYDFISEPSTPIKNGYTFAGWYSDSALTNPWNFTTSKVTSDMTLYAKWDESNSHLTEIDENTIIVTKPSNTNNNINTSDSTNTHLYIFFTVLSLLAFGIVIFKKKNI